MKIVFLKTFILVFEIGGGEQLIDDMDQFGNYELPHHSSSLSHQLRLGRGIIEECCMQPCSFKTLKSYCM